MKRILVLMCISFLLAGCKDEVQQPTDEKTQYVNEWIYGTMSQIYYWNTTLPTYKSSETNPSEYFKTLKYKDDRFSAIFENYEQISNELNGVSASEIGFDFQLYLENQINNNVIGIIRYVKRGTAAERLGLKRGDIFRKISGQQITTENYRNLLNNFFDTTSSASVTFSIYQNGNFTDKTAVTINKTSNYQENPVYLDTVYTVQNKKVGYLVYNFFTNDSGDKSMKYDLDLNNAIGKFKEQNVTELILDFRYNGGGMMSSAVDLASMIVPNLAADKVYAYTEFNKNYTDYFNSAEFKKQSNENPFVTNFATTIDASYPTIAKTAIQNIGNSLQRIYFLTGEGTASASEMVINGLKPFLPCVLIGDTTVGKNVGSTLVNDDQNKENQWAFMPIILKYFNKNRQSDFTKGFAPNYLVEDDCLNQLGDTREALLAKAISQISGVNSAVSKVKQIQRTSMKSSADFKYLRNRLFVDKKSVESFMTRNKKLTGN